MWVKRHFAFITVKMAALETQLELPKVFESSLCLVPPDESWYQIQRGRSELKDAGLLRWPPHINVLYPFVPNNHFGKVAPLLADVLRNLEPFEVTLAQFGAFHQRSSSVLYCIPEVTRGPSDSIAQLHALVGSVFPNCMKPVPFIPHMTVTHSTGREDCENSIALLSKWWVPVTYTVDQVHLISRKGPTKPFELSHRVFLGGQTSMDGSSVETRKSFELVGSPYPHMIDESNIDFAANARRELLESRKRGQRRRHQNPAAFEGHIKDQGAVGGIEGPI
jgi:2'-5' RNA ligase